MHGITGRSVRRLVSGFLALGGATAVNASIYTWSYTPPNPAQNAAGGQIVSIEAAFNTLTEEFSWYARFGAVPNRPDLLTDAFTLVVSPGPNPKNHPGEMAMAYFDATGGSPRLTIYGYNARNDMSSYFDGSNLTGTQPPDRIATSLNDLANVFADVSIVNHGDGTRTLGFTLDAASINAHLPLYPDPQDPWTGVEFGAFLGVWFHPFAGVTTAYADHYLSSFSWQKQGWLDANYLQTMMIPEPASLGLLALGGFVIARRSQRRAA